MTQREYEERVNLLKLEAMQAKENYMKEIAEYKAKKREISDKIYALQCDLQKVDLEFRQKLADLMKEGVTPGYGVNEIKSIVKQIFEEKDLEVAKQRLIDLYNYYTRDEND